MSVLTSIALIVVWFAAPPSSPPPKVGSIGSAPPPAWIEVGTHTGWLAYGIYCWTTTCVDMIPPATRPGLPTFRITRGQPVRVHLGFAATSASIHVLAPGKTVAVASAGKKTLAFRARPGIVLVEARAAKGSATYIARLRAR
jgi:hypothetical protein